MREIKFRAWDKSRRKMYDFLPCLMSRDPIQPTYFHILIEKAQEHFEVMQYTGLKDKNGVEIYEGDILQYVGAFEDEGDPDRYEVVWHKYGFRAEWLYSRDSGENALNGCDEDMIVIGNIYENPELLTKEEA